MTTPPIQDSVMTILTTDTGRVDELNAPILGSALPDILTGGILSFEELERVGFTRQENPDIYDPTTKRMLPFSVVKAREPIGIHGPRIKRGATKFSMFRQVIEIWLYSDGDGNYDTLNVARARIYELMEFTRVPGAMDFEVAYAIVDGRAPEASNARMQRVDFAIRGRYLTSSDL